MDINSFVIGYKKGKASGGGGGGGSSVSPKDVNFYDYDGTLLHSYTVEEAQALTELPPLPEQEGLICQGWNYDLATIKSYNRAVDVGATYITDDGKTRLYIGIVDDSRTEFPLYFNQTVANGVTIDWGDGSATETFSGTGYKSTTHIYPSGGEYVITLQVADGCRLEFGASNASVIGSGILYSQMNMLKKVEIGNNVTSIKNYSFRDNCSLSKITIPNGVTSIASSVFSYCYSLACVIFPHGVTSIGGTVFNSCYSLSVVSFPDSVKTISTNFSNCQSLSHIIFPNRVTTLPSQAFKELNALESVVLPSGLTKIDYETFDACYSLKSVTGQSGVTAISYRAFRNCWSLCNIELPSGLTSLGDNVFYSARALTSIVIPSGITSIKAYSFNDCKSMKVIDFSSFTAVPTLANTNAFSSIPADCIIRVPAALYDEWIAATNWSTYADQIVAV